MKIRIYFPAVLLVLNFISYTKAQSALFVGIGREFSTFKFLAKTNNLEQKLSESHQYSEVPSTTFCAAYTNVNSKGVLLSGGLDLRKAGATLVYKKNNFVWDMQYVDIKAGIGYQHNKWYLKPYIATLPYYAYLLNATQTIGQSYYDIKATEAVKAYDWGIFINLGIRAVVLPYTSVFAEYNYILGLNNIETAEKQYLYNRGFSVNLGLAFTIKKSNKPLSAPMNNKD